MDSYFLIYINHLGRNWCDNDVYEFIYSDIKVDVDGEYWDTYPASGAKVTPPKTDLIKCIGVLDTDMVFDVIADSTSFSVWDCVDGITPLGYENILDYDTYPENRLVFHFGITKKEVDNLLYSRDLSLEYKTIN